jgi:hypothetical protein
MRLIDFVPVRPARRLDRQMADPAPRDLNRARTAPWSTDRIAEWLVSRRDRLVEQLPRELSAARGLTRDQRELVVDEAIDYLVTEYAKPIAEVEALRRAFWAAASYRVKRVHEGRSATVRAGWQRVDVDDVDVQAHDLSPEAAVVRRAERHALLEFAASLTDTERRVLAAKYGDGAREQGRVVLARRLRLEIGEVRKAERDITQKLERFVAIMAAGTLCTHRLPAVTALAEGVAGVEQERIARLHLRECSACRAEYAAHVRALRSGELPRKIAQLLPVPATAEAGHRARGVRWDALSDWLGRPFAHDATVTGTQLAAGGRGIGTVVALKTAALCLGGAAVGGGAYCVAVGVPWEHGAPRTEQVRAHPAHPRAREASLPQAGRVAALAPQTTPTPSLRSSSASTPRSPSSHERDQTISPPPSAPSGTPPQEFGPESAAASNPQPAAAPLTAAPEFP